MNIKYQYKFMSSIEIPCEFCYENFSLELIDSHQASCYETQEKLLKKLSKTDIDKVNIDKIDETALIQKYIEPDLTETQQKAIAYVFKKSKIFSHSIELMLLGRFLEMDYTKEDFKIVTKFIKTVPIIIHFHPNKMMNYMIEDTHYRNLFETKTSSGSTSTTARTTWENVLFNKLYNDSVGTDRVKYGVININNDPTGSSAATSYGDSYIELKEEVKNRTSFTYGDSSQQDIHICSFKGFYNILFYMPKQCLKQIIDSALNSIQGKDVVPIKGMSYIESQYHGPIRLKHDVNCLVINPKYKSDKDMIKKLNMFTHTHNVPWRYMN